MDKFEKCITNANDIYVYFEVINQVEPKSVLDVGMFLKRMGAISRQAMLRTIDSDIYMCGVDCMEDCDAKVYSTVYNRIVGLSKFGETIEKENRKYDLAYMLGGCLRDSGKMWQYVVTHAKHAVTDRDEFEKNKQLLGGFHCRELKLDEDNYVIVTFN